MIDKNRADEVFHAYTEQYDSGNSMIRSKVDHTIRVASLCERIAEGGKMDEADAGFAWYLGLLHDIGRFEQARIYQTFVDDASVDHAEFGADLLFRDGLIHSFPLEGIPENGLEVMETAIRLHNKLSLPENLDARTMMFCQILRDADKVDIFRVITELSFEKIVGSRKDLFCEADGACDEVMTCVYAHRCVPRNLRKNRFDCRISHGCMAFELVFGTSREIVREQGFLDQILGEVDKDGNRLWSAKECEQLRILRHEIERAWARENVL